MPVTVSFNNPNHTAACDQLKQNFGENGTTAMAIIIGLCLVAEALEKQTEAIKKVTKLVDQIDVGGVE